MSILTLEIRCENAALSDNEPAERNRELARILAQAAARILEGNPEATLEAQPFSAPFDLFDRNGGRVGWFKITP